MIKIVGEKRVVGLIIAIIMVLIIPIVNAEDITSAASAKTASALPLPQLHFNNSQEKVIITKELSLGKTFSTTDIL
jgi:hypothetical protein